MAGPVRRCAEIPRPPVFAHLLGPAVLLRSGITSQLCVLVAHGIGEKILEDVQGAVLAARCASPTVPGTRLRESPEHVGGASLLPHRLTSRCVFCYSAPISSQ